MEAEAEASSPSPLDPLSQLSKLVLNKRTKDVIFIIRRTPLQFIRLCCYRMTSLLLNYFPKKTSYSKVPHRLKTRE